MAPDRRSAGVPSSGTPGKQALPPGVSDPEIRTQLDRIRSSVPFRSSRRCLIFLDFVVRAALDGRVESLKERTIGVEVFSRDPNYDTNQDPVVRGTASEVRKRLAQYYQIPGHEQELKIDLPPGSYAPDFHKPAGALPVVPTAASTPRQVLNASPRIRHLRWLTGLIAVVFLSFAILIITRLTTKPKTVVDQFWAPMLHSSEPVLLCVGQPKVYNLLGNLEAEMSKRVVPNAHLAPGSANEKVTAPLSSIVPNWDRYLALGDAMCLADMAALFAQHEQPYHVRGGGSTSFADLRENPAVLIGGFTNDWTMRLTGQLRFTFAETPDQLTHYVHDARNPANRDWRLTNIWPAWNMPVDYAIVSRVLDPATGRVVVSAAGITQYGTEAAGEFLTSPSFLAQAIHRGPTNWQSKNLQVVLSTKVIGGTAGPPRVLAVDFW